MFDALRVFASAHLARADPRAQSYLHAKTRLARGKALPCRVLFFAGHALCVAERKYSTDYFHRFLKLRTVRKGAENSFRLPATSFQGIQLAAADDKYARKIFLGHDYIIETFVVLFIHVVRWLMLLDEVGFEYQRFEY